MKMVSGSTCAQTIILNIYKGEIIMFKKRTIAILAAVAALCLAVPVSAETFTSSDGVLSIELPNENWKQIEDPMKWIALSDGGSVITIDHFSNGEKLPEMTVADTHYVDVYQAVFSTQNEVFIITGSVVDAAKIPEIANSIISAKVLKYDTKLAVGKENEIKTDEFSIVPMDKTMYVTAEWLNVRRGCSLEDLVIGGLGYGAPVKVLGNVQRNGKDLGWYQVTYESGTGYVSASFLTDKAPSDQTDNGSAAPSDTTYSGAVKTVYDENGDSYTLYEGTDGYWRDKSGSLYLRLSESVFQVNEGTKRLFTYDPSQEVNVEGDPYDNPSLIVYDENGDSVRIYEGSDGYWHEDDGTAYIRLSDTVFQVKEGTRRVSTEGAYVDDGTEYDVNAEVNVEGDPYDRPSMTVYDESGESYWIYEGSDGYWHEDDGTAYVRLSNTVFQAKEGTRRVFTYDPSEDYDESESDEEDYDEEDIDYDNVNVEGDPYGDLTTGGDGYDEDYIYDEEEAYDDYDDVNVEGDPYGDLTTGGEDYDEEG